MFRRLTDWVAPVFSVAVMLSRLFSVSRAAAKLPAPICAVATSRIAVVDAACGLGMASNGFRRSKVVLKLADLNALAALAMVVRSSSGWPFGTALDAMAAARCNAASASRKDP